MIIFEPRRESLIGSVEVAFTGSYSFSERRLMAKKLALVESAKLFFYVNKKLWPNC